MLELCSQASAKDAIIQRNPGMTCLSLLLRHSYKAESMGYTCTDTEPAGSSNTPILSSFLLTRHALLSILQHLAPISLQRLIRCNHCQVKINSHCFRNRMSEFPTSRVRKMVCVRNSVCTCVRAHTHTRARASGVRVCVCRYVFSLSLVCL